MKWKQPAWYRWTEAQLNGIGWLIYLVAGILIGITLWLAILSATGHKTKTLLVAWITYLLMP